MPDERLPPLVSVLPVTRDNWRAMLELSVRPDQQRFVADYAPLALVILAKARVGAAGLDWYPYALYEGDAPIGMFALATSLEIGEECWVYHFFLDRQAQGIGLGHASLDALTDCVLRDFPSARRVVLSVHPENLVARALYERRGFVATGEQLDGEDVLVLAMDDLTATRGVSPRAT